MRKEELGRLIIVSAFIYVLIQWLLTLGCLCLYPMIWVHDAGWGDVGLFLVDLPLIASYITCIVLMLFLMNAAIDEAFDDWTDICNRRGWW